MGRGPGPGKEGPKNAKTPPLIVVPSIHAKPKTKSFFRSQLEDLLNSV